MFFYEWLLLMMLTLMKEEQENAADFSYQTFSSIFFFPQVFALIYFAEPLLCFFWKEKYATKQ